jgi:hypothetical protein
LPATRTAFALSRSARFTMLPRLVVGHIPRSGGFVVDGLADTPEVFLG